VNKFDFITHKDCEVFQDHDLSSYSTMKLAARGDLIVVKSLAALKFLVKELSQRKMEYQVIGWGANTLLSQNAEKIFLHLKIANHEGVLSEVKDRYLLSATTSIATLVSAASKLGLSGWEVLTGIPGSLGGAIAMNAGTKFGEIAKIVDKVYVLDKDGKEKIIIMNGDSFSYRKNHFLKNGDVIYQAELKHLGIDPAVNKKITDYLQFRNQTQPLKSATCGCIFKNSETKAKTCPAGLYIDIIGLKGFSYKDMAISHLHGNFMMNTGAATKEDVLELIKLVEEELYLYFGIKFQKEVVV
jgi:UDP-N-acetylmuramate dehydrogenase